MLRMKFISLCFKVSTSFDLILSQPGQSVNSEAGRRRDQATADGQPTPAGPSALRGTTDPHAAYRAEPLTARGTRPDKLTATFAPCPRKADPRHGEAQRRQGGASTKKGPGGGATRKRGAAARPPGPGSRPGRSREADPCGGDPAGGRAGTEGSAERSKGDRTGSPQPSAARPGGQTTAASADRKPAAQRGRREAERESRGGAGGPAGAKRRAAAGGARRRGRATAQPGRKAPGVRKRGGRQADRAAYRGWRRSAAEEPCGTGGPPEGDRGPGPLAPLAGALRGPGPQPRGFRLLGASFT